MNWKRASKGYSAKLANTIATRTKIQKWAHLATWKQVEFMKKLGYVGETKHLTKKEASELIDKLLGKKRSLVSSRHEQKKIEDCEALD